MSSMFKLHPPSAPREDRFKSALALAVTMPLWWPILCGMLFLVFLLLGLVLVLMAVILLAMPLVAAMGVDEKDEETFKVTAPKDKVLSLKLAVQEKGGQIEE